MISGAAAPNAIGLLFAMKLNVSVRPEAEVGNQRRRQKDSENAEGC
jgi:hypothetical protein